MISLQGYTRFVKLKFDPMKNFNPHFKSTNKVTYKLFFIAAFSLITGFQTTLATVYKVTTNADAGAGSLREAITSANNDAIRDTIVFSDLAWASIKLATGLMATQPVVIDGTTAQSWAPGSPVIELNGNGVADPVLFLNATNGSVIKGLIINRSASNGVFILNGGNNSVSGCFIGTDSTGLVAKPNSAHGMLSLTSGNNVIGGATLAERNVVAGNGAHGIMFQDASNGNILINNYVGLGKDGTTVLGNSVGVFFLNNCDKNTIGGSSFSQRNSICNNKALGLKFENGCDSNTVTGNFIGVDINNNAKGNLSEGIQVWSACNGNKIGGSTPNLRNIISGNLGLGIYVNIGSIQNLIEGNYIGVDSTGSIRMGNGADGVQVNASNNATVRGNVISGNKGHGVNAVGNSAATLITGNVIGLNANKDAAISNHENGVSLTSVTGTIIGGSGPGEGNFISGNGYNAGATLVSGNRASGVSMSNCTNMQVIRNVIGFTKDTVTAAGNSDYGIWDNNSTNLIYSYNIIGNNGFGTDSLTCSGKKCAYGSGININGAVTTAVIRGNWIGIDAKGNAKGNANYGVWLNNTSNVALGGVGANDGNIISGNLKQGVFLGNAKNDTIYGNRIGVDAKGAAKGNKGNGIAIYSGSSGNIIGGILPGQANIIANNDSNGVSIADAGSINNSIHRNSIYCNTLRGIELNGKGNANYPAPKIDIASTPTSVTGKATPNSTVEIFTIGAAPCTDCTVPGSKRIQGKSYQGSVTALADSSWSYTPLVALTEIVVATASGSASGSGNTSEFSACPSLCANPQIAAQPKNDTVCVNSTAQFVVIATGAVGGYKWMVDKNTGTFVPVADDATYSGAQNDTLEVKTTIAINGYKFQSIAVGPTPSCTSATNIVHVKVDSLSVPGTVAQVSPVCKNQTATLLLSGQSGNIQWMQSTNGVNNFLNVNGGTGATASTFTTPVLSDTIYYRASVRNGKCPSLNSNVVRVVVSTPPVGGTATNNSPVCIGTADTIKLNQPYYGSIQWQMADSNISPAWTPVSGALNQSYTTPPLYSKAYFRAELSTNGCPAVYSTVAASTVKTNPPFSAGNDTVVCDGTKFTLKATPGFSNYVWQTGAETPTIEASHSGSFWVTAKAPNDCSVSDTVKVSNCDNLTIPNVFTPGSDGLNDYFVIQGIQPEAKLDVFNRWGELVFKSHSYDNTWDGNDLSEGVYYYIYQPANGKKPAVGWVSLIKE